MATQLKRDDITLLQVFEELTYREDTNGMRWNDDLYAYPTEELQAVELNWNK